MKHFSEFIHIPVDVLVGNTLGKPTVLVFIPQHIAPRTLIAVGEEDTTPDSIPSTARAGRESPVPGVL